jgi:hypothetical protein
MGGGSPSVQQAQPLEGYNAGMLGQLSLGRGLAEQAAGASPELSRADIPYLQETARREAIINAFNSADLERQMSPETARMRTGLASQMEEDFSGGPSRELSNMWMRQGLQDVIATGARSDSGFARSALADRSRRDYFANRQGLQDRVAGFLAANPTPVAGLDPGSLAGIIGQVSSDNVNLRNAYQQQVLGALGAQAGNVSNAFQQQAQMEMARRSQNAQAQNAASIAGSQNSSALMGAGIGAAGAIAGGAIVL